MIRNIVAAAMLLVVLTGCAMPRETPVSGSRLPPSAPPSSNVTSMDSGRDIVLAVANPLSTPSTHAGSTLLGYAPAAHYGAGQRAIGVLSDLKKKYALQEVTGWPIKSLEVYCVVVRPAPGVDRDTLLATLTRDDRVQLAQPLHEYEVYSKAPPSGSDPGHQYNDPYTDLQHGFVETHAAVAHEISQGEGIRVAVVDTGLDASHPDLKGHIDDTRNAVDDDRVAFAHDSHGTEVAGIIAAVGDNHVGMVGIAPKARLDIFKACWYVPGDNGGARCNSFTLAKALAAVGDTDARVVNLSLGGPADPLLSKLLAKILEQGRIVVSAMPPEGRPKGFPDSAPGVIIVRSSTAGSAPPGVVSAPGNDILTTQPGGGFDFTSGSSMATAHVSGIVALLLSLSPGLDAAAIHDILLRTSSLSNGVVQVNAAAAVESVQERKTAVARRG